MRYVLRTGIGFTLVVASLVTISLLIYELLQIGTCASGGPYVVAQECPDGTTAMGAVLPISIFALPASFSCPSASRSSPPRWC